MRLAVLHGDGGRVLHRAGHEEQGCKGVHLAETVHDGQEERGCQRALGRSRHVKGLFVCSLCQVVLFLILFKKPEELVFSAHFLLDEPCR